MTTRPATAKRSTVKTAEGKKPASRNSATRTPAAKTTRAKTASAAADRQPGDMPILPVDQLERLHAIKPDAVDWVIRQAQIEAEHRREETSRVNGFIFFENLFGQFAALVIGAAGVIGGSWVAVNGQPWAGVAIAAAVIGGLAAVFFAGKAPRK